METELKKLEELVIDSYNNEENLSESQVFSDKHELSLAGTATLSLNGEIKHTNTSFIKMLNYNRNDFIFEKIQSISCSCDWETEKTFFSLDTHRDKGFVEYDKKFIDSSGNPLWAKVRLSLFHSAAGAPLYFLYQYQDITEHKKTLAELQVTSKKFSTLLDQVHDGFWDWHFKEDYEYMSPRFWEMLGYDPDQKKHHPSEWQKIIFPEDAELSRKNLDLHIQTKGKHPFKQEVRYKHQDGSTVWLICIGDVIEWDEHGLPIRMVGTHTDITKLKEAQEALSLNLRLAALGEMAGSISHEINNPLAIINISMDWMSKAIRLKDVDQEKFLTKIGIVQKNIKRASSTIEGLRIYAGDINNGQKSNHSLSKVLQLTLDLLNDRLKNHKVEVINQIDESLHLICDKAQVSHIFFNLISNAIDALEGKEGGWVKVLSFTDNGSTKIQIIDGGPGISPQAKKKIMAPLFSSKSTDSESGLGLSVSKTIAENHGGTLKLLEDKAFTTFELSFPKSKYDFFSKPTIVSEAS